MTATYAEFLESKQRVIVPAGFECGELNPHLFDWQEAIVRWALRQGRAGVFVGTGLGKTLMQLAIADSVVRHTGERFLLLAPLAVSNQTLREAEKFGITGVTVAASHAEVQPGITITNYEKLHKFDVSEFSGVGLDEGSLLKSVDGKTRKSLIESFGSTPYRYVFTATPAPNDTMELGSYCEFLGVCTRSEMLSMYFVHDGGETSKWRLKGHAEREFYRWMASWSVMMENPSDLGYDGSRFILPELRFHRHIVESTKPPSGSLFHMEAKTLSEQREVRRDTIEERTAVVSELANATDDLWVVWCNLNAESTAAAKSIDDSVEVRGSQSNDDKEERLLAFISQHKRALVSKPSIAGFGLNLQFCSKVAFLGLSHSFEQTYQAIRRCWRFGQRNPVDVHVVVSDRDSAILESIDRKQANHEAMIRGMIEATSEHSRHQLCGRKVNRTEYSPTVELEIPTWMKA